jgi:hypothetical protein
VQTAEQINGTEMPLARIRSNGHRRNDLSLLLANLQNSTQRLRGGAAIAFTSASGGEGVSHVTQLFAVELARHTGRRTLIVSAERMQSLGIEDYLKMPWNCHPTNIENVWMLPAKKTGKKNGAEADEDDAQELPQR